MMSTSSQLPSPAPILANGVGLGGLPPNDGDDRSSSLSDIEDRTANAELGVHAQKVGGDSEANDTEAETERLEDSPQKIRKHKNVVLNSSNNVYQDSATVAEHDEVFMNDNPHRPEILGDSTEGYLAHEPDRVEARVDPVSEISSLEDSSEGVERSILRAKTKSRKRKRQSPRSNSQSEGEETEIVLMANKEPPPSQAPIRSALSDNESRIEASYAENDLNSSTDKREYSGIEAASSQHLSPSKSKGKKGKRKAKKTKVEDPEQADIAVAYTNGQIDRFDNMDQADSNGDDAEMEEIDDGAEADAAARTEEGLLKKKSAMDSLGAIEKCFATLRDKLFDERLSQYNDELAMLSQPLPTHPEYLAQKEVVDRYRDDKIEYEETLFRYKLIALQRKSIAEKAQIHSQYMQTVREIRDSNLEQLNKEWYQIQRERRSCDDSEPDYMYKFQTRRSQQIRQQTAYNTEVSILSGVAKYVGFPAAPDIMKARPKEIEDDLAGIAAAMSQTHSQASQPMQRQPSSLRANPSSATAGFPRQKPAAEERFLEQNPWANPQHPAHHQQHHPVQRQFSNLSRPASPFSTPIGQRRIVDLTTAQGFASTIAEPLSRPSSPMAPTPVTSEQMVQSGRQNQASLANINSSATPSGLVAMPVAGPTPGPLVPITLNEKANVVHPSIVERPEASRSLQNPGHDVSDDSNNASRLLPLNNGMALSSPPNLPMSPQTQYPLIKAEDASQPAHRSPALTYYEPLGSNGISTNGHQERFGVL